MNQTFRPDMSGFDVVARALRGQGPEKTSAAQGVVKPLPVAQHRGMNRAERRARQRKGYNVPAYRNTPLEKENDDV